MQEPDALRFVAVGLDHGHIFKQVGRLLEIGATCVGYWSRDDALPLPAFAEGFPAIPRVDDRHRLIEDPAVHLVVTAAVPVQRAGIAIEAMHHGKDVMTDKPGVISFAQLEEVKRAQAATGRIWSVNFSERFESRAATRAAELLEVGAIGRVVHTAGFGPHRLNANLRPPWFFDPAQNGGILVDIASHQIDQFLHFTGSADAEVVASSIGNYANPDRPQFEDFGEVLLRGDGAHGYVRVDWYTPDGLPTWGDGRLMILGTRGYIELRKYIDVAGRPGADHLFLVTNEETRHSDCADAPLPYYERLRNDILDRTETAMSQAHCFKVCKLALRAEAQARRMPGPHGAGAEP